MGGNTNGGVVLAILGGDLSAVDVYAGSNHSDPDSHSQNRIGGDVALIIQGGTFSNISGGSVNGRHDRDPGLIKGSSIVQIDTSSAPVTINGDIYASSGAMDGFAIVVFRGTGDIPVLL